MIDNFYQGDFFGFTGVINVDGSPIDISYPSEVRFMIKTKKSDPDLSALLNITADVTTEGASGVYMFLGASLITADKTKTITPGTYYYEIIWDYNVGQPGIMKKVLESGTVKVLERVADV